MQTTSVFGVRRRQEFDLAGSVEADIRQLLMSRSAIDHLYRLAALVLGNGAEAEDATQDAVARAWGSAGSLRRPESAVAWVDRILVNVCRDRIRRRQIVRFIPLADGLGQVGIDPFKAILDRDEALRVMSQLDGDQRIVVVLHYWAGLTLDEVAIRTGWPTGTVKSRLHHALVMMRNQLEARSDQESGS